ncbi:PREDICTED: uncharacterized protein LOC106790554 [Polistes canadensis]|uniref:uncharacterized protein LOC106790554 n=1 Tax=Polistes canadensis TaxID=91411 RepID=UPI000718BEA4|nr:PREDICTED: uncharacterized protein LOC106790554 [Polistes canadensis]
MSECDSNGKILETVLSCLKKFDPKKENFIKWHNVVEETFNMLKIKNNRKSYVLLNILKSSVLTYVRSHVKPDDLFSIPYEMLVTILEEEYSPDGKFLSTMYRFTIRDQFKGESIENYYCTIKKLIDKFDNSPEAKSRLLFRFIYGLQNEKLRKDLLELSNITIYKALLIAMKMEFIEESSLTYCFEDEWLHNLQELRNEEERAGKTGIISVWDSNEKILERVLSCLKKFDPKKEHFIKWLDVLELLLDMSKIENNRRSYILLNVLESSVLTYVQSHVKPDDPFSIPYEMLVTILDEEYSPYSKFQSLMSRFTFRDQMKGESIENYYYSLKKLNCKLDKGPSAKSNLLFRFIYGLQNKEICKQLQETPNLTIYSAMVIAMKIEFKRLSSKTNLFEDQWLYLLHELKKEEERERQTSSPQKEI